MRASKKIGLAAMLTAAVMTVGGVAAAWTYAEEPIVKQQGEVTMTAGEFKYGSLFITRSKVIGGSYASASARTTADLKSSVDLQLNAEPSSTVLVQIDFHNDSNVTYYYNTTETVTTDNAAITYTVKGIEYEQAVAPKEQISLQVEFSYENSSNVSNGDILTELRFLFKVDKEAVGDIVATTAVEQFENILNNKVADDSYTQLETAMDNRDGGFNKGSAVTYIGNVAGANTTDSQAIEGLFGEEFMTMDVDGDGEVEPITMMIKRENLDGNTATGDSYTYTSWGRETTVNGVEMTLYITAESFAGKSQGAEMVVYAVVYTIPEGGSEWVEVVGLTKGTAEANNYSNGSWGTVNSFNTDTWRAENGRTIEDLIP